jgi:hypothetical protein
MKKSNVLKIIKSDYIMNYCLRYCIYKQVHENCFSCIISNNFQDGCSDKL